MRSRWGSISRWSNRCWRSGAGGDGGILLAGNMRKEKIECWAGLEERRQEGNARKRKAELLITLCFPLIFENKKIRGDRGRDIVR
jgi:hypothetical protein